LKRPYVAFDLGATSWRVFLGWEEGSSFTLEEIFRKQHQPFEKDGGLFWDIEGIFRHMRRVLREVAEQGMQPSAIGIDSWSVDYGLIDENGSLLETPRCYRDPRNQGMVLKLARSIGLDELFLRSGVMCEEITTLCQLIAAKQQTPTLLENAQHLLFIPDLLRYWLCGNPATDFTLASTSQLYNLRHKDWDQDLLSRFDIHTEILPKIFYGSTVLATLSEELQRETGLGPVPITTGASHDTAAAFSTVRADDSTVILSSGTWSMLGVHMTQPVFSPEIDPERFGYEGNPDGTFRFLCNIPGMWILEQCRLVWKRQGIPCSHTSLTESARLAVDFNSSIDPYDARFVLPEDMTDAVREYCRETGQRVPESPGEITRAILRGLVHSYVKAIGEIEKIQQRKIRKLCIIGGGSRNQFLNHLIEEKTGVRVLKGWAEASTMGNVMNQKQALKNWDASGLS